MHSLTPPRRRGTEILDDPHVDPRIALRSMKDVERANNLFGGRRAALTELRPVLEKLHGRATLLDVGTGRGDIAWAARREAKTMGLDLETYGLDSSLPLLSHPHCKTQIVIRGDALALPLGNSCVDVVLASQILHHFTEPDSITVIRELNRVALSRVVISDLRRSFVAAAGLWLGSFPLRFDPVSRHDGVVSVMRGFLAFELADLVEKAIGYRPIVNRRLGFRLTASWRPVR